MSERTIENTIHVTLPPSPERGQLTDISGPGRYFVSSATPEIHPVVTRTTNESAHPYAYNGVHASSGCLVDVGEHWRFQFHAEMRCWPGLRRRAP